MTSAPPRKAVVAAAFGAAAETYDAGAGLQREVARRLADRAAALPLPPRPRILEIGCGTGLLSQALRARLGPAQWVITDLSPAMLARCREALGDPPDTVFQVMDGEHPETSSPDADLPDVDLIISSLAFQWFEDLDAALPRLAARLRPGGHLVFATLAVDTFQEWREAHAALGLACGVPHYPTPATLARRCRIEHEHIARHHPDAAAFLAELKRIGAAVPAPGRPPLPPGALRRVLRRFDAGLTITWHIAYGHWAYGHWESPP